MNPSSLPSPVEVTCRDIVSDGRGVGVLPDGRVVMVAGLLPDEKALVEVADAPAFRRVLSGRLLEITAFSPARREHPCPYYKSGCPGSPMGILDYDNQLQIKRRSVQQALQRIGKLSFMSLDSMIPSPQQWGYRDRIELRLHFQRGQNCTHFTGDDALIPVETCLLASKLLQDSIFAINNYPPPRRSLPTNGVYRLYLRDNGRDATSAIVFICGTNDANAIDVLIEWLEILPLTGWQLRMVDRIEARFTGSVLVEKGGDPTLLYPIGNNFLILPPNVFTQANRSLSMRLVQEALKLLPPDARVLDLFGGYGAFGLVHAQRGGEAVVIDNVGDSLEAGRTYAQDQKLPVDFLKMDLERPVGLTDWLKKCDAVIVDPPRGGIPRGAIRMLNKYGPPRFIYVSCHPAALARDLGLLTAYQPVYFQPLDMFPQTPEVETVAVLARTGS